MNLIMKLEKGLFDVRQQKLQFERGKCLICVNESDVRLENEGGTEKLCYSYDMAWVDASNEAQAVENLKKRLLDEITAYDMSGSVNSFKLNGLSVWLDKGTRVGLMNSTQIGKAAGNESTTLWLGNNSLTILCDKAIELLSALEMYALACYNVTAQHKANVNTLTDIESIVNYDYTSGYPEKLDLKTY